MKRVVDGTREGPLPRVFHVCGGRSVWWSRSRGRQCEQPLTGTNEPDRFIPAGGSRGSAGRSSCSRGEMPASASSSYRGARASRNPPSRATWTLHADIAAAFGLNGDDGASGQVIGLTSRSRRNPSFRSQVLVAYEGPTWTAHCQHSDRPALLNSCCRCGTRVMGASHRRSKSRCDLATCVGCEHCGCRG